VILGKWGLHSKRNARCLAAMDEPLDGFLQEWNSIQDPLFRPVAEHGSLECGHWVAVLVKPNDCQEALAEHFFGDSGKQSSFAGSAFEFERLTTWIVKHLIATGYCLLLCDWQQIPSVQGSAVWLPFSPRLVNPEDLVLIERPHMPPLCWIRLAHRSRWRRVLADESISVLRLGHRPPAMAAWPFLRDIRNYWDSGMYRSQGSAQPDNRELVVERARFTSQGELWRRYVVAKFRTAHAFGTVPNSILAYSPTQVITEYYDGYIACRHAKEMLSLRGLVMDVLNETLMRELGERNQGKLTALFSLRASTVDPDTLWREYREGKIGLMELSDQLNSV